MATLPVGRVPVNCEIVPNSKIVQNWCKIVKKCPSTDSRVSADIRIVFSTTWNPPGDPSMELEAASIKPGSGTVQGSQEGMAENVEQITQPVTSE